MYSIEPITFHSEKPSKGLKDFASFSILKNWFIILFLAFISAALAIGISFSAKITLQIFVFTFIILTTFIQPFIGVLFYIIALYVRPMELMAIGMPLMKILALSILVSWLLHVLVRRQRDFVNAPQNFLIIAFLALILISYRTYIHGIIDELTGDFARIVVIYFLIINLITDERRLRITIWILMLSTLWLSVHGILLSRGIEIGPVELSQDNRVTSSGIFGDPNDLAQAIVVAIPFVFNFLFSKRSTLIKVFIGVVGAVMLFAFLLTGSRGGFIGLAVVMFLLLRRKFGIAVGSAAVVLALVGLLLVAPSSTVERVKTTHPTRILVQIA